MSFRGQQGITRCHFMFFTIVLRRPTIWQVYERTTNSIDPLTISSFTFFERILPEVVFVVYSSFVPISEKKICFWSGATWVANGHWQVLNGGIPEAVICSNKPTGGQRQSSYSSPRKCIEMIFLEIVNNWLSMRQNSYGGPPFQLSSKTIATIFGY